MKKENVEDTGSPAKKYSDQWKKEYKIFIDHLSDVVHDGESKFITKEEVKKFLRIEL